MLKYRKLTDLTDEEIKFAINDIIQPVYIGEIKRDYKWDTIDVDVTIDWGEAGKEDLITDTITLHYDKLSVILICLNTKKGLGEPGSLHHFLNVLLSPSMASGKKEQILSQMYGITLKDEIRKELVSMCNLGEAIEENALKKGRSQGRKEGQKVGRAEKLVQNVEAAMKNFHLDLRTACEGLGSSLKEYERAKKLLKG